MNVTEKSHIKVKWEDVPENFTKERQNRIKSYFQRKYNTKNVIVQLSPLNEAGEDFTLGQQDLIYDLANQKQLIEDFIKDNEIDIKLSEITRLDNRVMEKLKEAKDIDSSYRRLKIKEIWFDNFLCFGDNNKIPYGEMDGVTVVNSNPPNFGGKTTATVDLLLYLFFNKTTKTKKDIELFNLYREDVKTVTVGGLIEINNQEYVIERTLTKSGKKKITTNSQLKYSKLVNGEQQDLSEEQRKETDKLINETIGTYDDFLITIIATAKNLEDLFQQKPTERGNLLTRFIGLDLIREKEAMCKEIKSEWEKNIKSNHYNIIELEGEIDDANDIIEENNEKKTLAENKIKELTETIKILEEKKELLIGKKKEIDDELLKLNLTDEKNKLDEMKETGAKKKEEYMNFKEELDSREIPEYDEEGHESAIKKEKKLTQKIYDQKALIKEKEREIEKLDEEIQRKLAIKESELKSDKLTKESEITNKKQQIRDIKVEREKQITKKENEVEKLELSRESIKKEKQTEITRLEKLNKQLEEDEICPTCKRPFENCDNSGQIDENKKKIKKLQTEIEHFDNSEITKLQDEIAGLQKFQDPQVTKIEEDIKKIKIEIDDIGGEEYKKEVEFIKKSKDGPKQEINKKINEINTVTIPKIEKEKDELSKKIDKFVKQNDAVTQYERDKVKLSRLEIELKGLGQDYRDQEELIKKYEKNMVAVEENRKVEQEIITTRAQIELKGQDKDTKLKETQLLEDDNKKQDEIIKTNNELVKIINKEEEILKIFDIYLRIFGKKGISKTILKNAIPVINTELDRLLNDTAEFSMSLDINDKNDVEYWMTDRETDLSKLITSTSGFEGTVAALALRAVLTKVSVLPKPDMIVLDEVFGKVADQNLELVKHLIDKISEMFSKVILITHNQLVKDWGNNILTIEKIDNVSKLNIETGVLRAQV